MENGSVENGSTNGWMANEGPCQPSFYGEYTLRSLIEAPFITREVLPETYFLLVIMAADAQVGPFLLFQASCLCGTL
jgi:hypothetical protein